MVDEIGGIDKAIAIAKDLAKLTDYKTVDYPKLKDPFEQFIISLSEGAEAKILKTYMGENYKYYQKVQTIGTQSGYMTRMPYEIDFH